MQNKNLLHHIAQITVALDRQIAAVLTSNEESLAIYWNSRPVSFKSS